MDEKNGKKLYNICTKLTTVYTSFYITKNGYILSTDKEKPFLIQLNDDTLSLFIEACGEFKLIHIKDVRIFKKGLPVKLKNEEDRIDIKTTFREVTSDNEKRNVLILLNERLEDINLCKKWEKFILSDDSENNEELILSLFKENNYINFTPKDNIDGPDIIMTKSLIPLVSEKNYTDLYYSSRKKGDNLYMIIFDFQFELFRLCMFHHYIPMDDDH